MILKLFFCIITFCTLSSPCLASLALRSKAFNPACKKQKREELRISPDMKVIKEAPIFTKKDVASIIPTQYSEDESSQHVVNRILQNSANAILNSSVIQKSFLMKTAKQVEDTTKVDVSIKQEGRNTASQETEHKFKFDVQALKGLANVKYSGLFDSKIEYQATNGAMIVSLEEHLSGNSKIALSHSKDSHQSLQMLQYQISW